MFAAMPALVLTSKLVPKGLEATTYALLAGFQVRAASNRGDGKREGCLGGRVMSWA